MDSNSQTEDILRPLTSIELDNLLLLYKNNYSESNFHYLSLATQCKWNRQLKELDDDGLNTKWKPFRKSFYTHRNGNLANGTYVYLHWDLMLTVQFHSLQTSLNELKECLLNTKRIDWKTGPLVAGVFLENYETVKDILHAVGAVIDRPRECHCSILKTNALEFPEPVLPDGYTLRKLEPSDGDLIHPLWANKGEGSLDYIRGLTVLNKTIGLVRSKDNALVGWIFQNDFCGLGILQVLPEEQKKGFGNILSIKLCREIALEGLGVDICVFIVKENASSAKLMQKVGFRLFKKSMWIQCKNL